MTAITRTPEDCRYRCLADTGDEGDAVCTLLKEIVGIQQQSTFMVAHEACQACCESFPPSDNDLNPVVASLLYSITETIVDDGGTEGCDLEKAKELNLWAERSLPAVSPDEDDSVDMSRENYDHLRRVTREQIQELLPLPADRSAKIKTWAVGVTTSPRRVSTIESCVKSILDSGWMDPVLFIDGDVDLPPSLVHLNTCRRTPALGAFPNFVLSLSELYMRQPHADAYLMLQDDAQLLGTPALREYLEQALWFDEGPCIASLYCSKKYNQETPGWHRFSEHWVWGAVAFVFSRDAVRAVLTSPIPLDHRALPEKEGLSKIDVVLGYFALNHDVPIYFPSPSLVQHIGTVSTIWKVARAVNARRADQFLGDLIGKP